MENHTSHPHEASKKEVPVVLQVIGVLMGLYGLGYFLLGIPLLLALGFGLILMVFGGIMMYFGMKVYSADKNAYVPALVLGILALLNELRSSRMISLVIALAFLYAIYTNKEQFVN